MALGCILRQHYRYATALLTASAVIFRSDTLVFAAPFVLSMFISKKVTFFHFLSTGFATAIPCILISVAVDSFFWRRLLWPEALVFLFNTVQNKSAEWGTLPWNWWVFVCFLQQDLDPLRVFYNHNNCNFNHRYFTSAIPRMLMAPVLLLGAIVPYDILTLINNKKNMKRKFIV